MTTRKGTIAAAFSAAATSYESAAEAQRRVADSLIMRLGMPVPVRRVLELGCGTGLLSRRLLAILPEDASLLATDLSPAMIATASASLADPRLGFAVMDAEAPALAESGFDLVISSLAAQWFADLPATLQRLTDLMAPGGRMLIATLGSETFGQWRQAHRNAGEESGIPAYPDAAALAAMLPGSRVDTSAFTLDYADARAFLNSLSALGAATPKPGHRPLPPGRLRRIMAGLGSPCAITWDILTLDYRKDGP
ncbi:MAG: methyltransferase domain-containing protein [Magnetospirillum sp.]|nr:methyltransferase domain-containing protein [Magnetospirillum sp.]